MENNTYQPQLEMDLKALKKRGIITIETLKTSGPGGQRKNKSETAVRITHLPTGIQALGNESTQKASKKAAFKTLLERLEEHFRPREERIPTKVPKSAKKARLKEKRVRSEKKRLRENQLRSEEE